jgi:2-polyprenyl-6-methoxyphenol hydroxylase-like FAD-dependent oxidoreductase/ferredoxin-NADP reductase
MGESMSDVIIVGAGPAGCVLAILLARSGVQVTLVEQDTQLDRGFRGPAYQPSALRIWEEMDVLKDILALDHAKFSNFTFLEKGKPLLSMDLSDLPEPFNYILVMKQAPLLRCLIKQAARYPNFDYFGGVKATGLIMKEGGVAGITASIMGEETTLHSKLVVAADGRFSTVRKSAGIPLKLINQQFDVVWFELPHDMDSDVELGFHITDHGFLVFLPKENNTLQIGLVLGKGRYPELRKKGIDEFINQIIAVEPPLKDVVKKYMKSWDQCELLDVKMGVAEKWSQNGLLLMGDAAHIASPIGGIGNKLAIEDAVVAYPYIMRALKESSGPISQDLMDGFENDRRQDIEAALNFQKIAGKMILELKNPFLRKVRGWIAPHMKNSFMYKKMRKLIAFSPHDIHVDKQTLAEHALNPKYLFYPLTVTQIKQETPLAKSLTLEIPDSIKTLYTFKAGQFVTVKDLVDGVIVKRCYSISVPEGEGRIRITVKRQNDGLFSSYLHDQVQEGDQLLVSIPSGGFIVHEKTKKQNIFFSGGSGVTPIFSLVSTLLQHDTEASISLFNVNSDESDIIFHEELRNLEKRHLNFSVENILTRSNGRPDGQMIDTWLSKVTALTSLDNEFYLCGPQSFMDLVHNELKKRGTSSSNIHIENFMSASGLQELRRIPSKESAACKEVGNPSIPSGSPKNLFIELEGKQVKVSIEEDETLLDACLREGLNIPFSCQEGICGTCMAHLDEGRVYMDKHAALSDEDIASERILTCRAKAETETCKISYPKKSS